jgi:hypothetical protein
MRVSDQREPIALLDADEAQVIDNVMHDTAVPAHTRRAVLGRVALGAAGALGASMLAGPARALATADTIQSVGTTAVTAEALAVTYLTEVLKKAPHGTPKHVAAIIHAARAEEQAHYDFLHGAGFRPLTTKFWIPNDFFGSLKQIAATIEIAETIFVNAYLVGITTFAQAGKPDLARYAGEILGVEAEHRALARELQGKLPNNRAFELYLYTTTDQHVAALTRAGVGFGKRGSKPGRFFHYHRVSTHGITGIKPR